MEGPSLFLAQEQLIVFKGKKIKLVTGNTKIGKERLLDKKVLDIFSWGKHLVFQFDEFAVRTHFMLFGTFEADVEGISVTGDYKKSQTPRLKMTFENGDITMFNCSLKIFETSNLKSTYDYSIDVMSKEFNSEQALKHVKENVDQEIADVLLDQEIFAGVGNIIKNEVLSITKVNPKQKVKNISENKIKEVIETAVLFSHDFYKWRKKFALKKNLKIYRKSICPHCGEKVIREKTGKRARVSFYCKICQPYL